MLMVKKRKYLSYLSVMSIFAVIIAILCCSIFVAMNNNDTASATVLSSTTADVITTDLLLSDYTTRSDGAAFNDSVLSNIFKKVTGNSSATYSTVETAAKDTTGKGTDTTMHSGRDALQIKNGNSNKYVVLTIGNLRWTVMSLSTNSSNEPILTLILTDTSQSEVGQWSTWTETASNQFSGTYPVSMYSTSYLRAQLLNGKNASGVAVKYSTNNSTLATYSRPMSLFNKTLGGYKFDIFAHNSATGSLTKYLVQPKDIPYQQSESFYKASQAVWGNCYGFNDASKYKEGISPNGSVENQTNYFDWASDYIWIPSTPEIGWGNNKDIYFYGMWNTTTPTTYDVMGTSTYYWGRTVLNTNRNTVVHGFATPSSTDPDNLYNYGEWTTIDNQTNYIRPCIHLNLKEAYNAAITTITNPSNLNPTYDGDPKDIESSSWYNSSNYSSSKANVKVEYLDASGNALSIPKPINADTYKVRLTIQNSKYGWATSGTGTGSAAGKVKEITLKIEKRQLKVNFTTASPPDEPTATPADLVSADSALSGSILRIRYTGVNVTYDSLTAPPSNAIGKYTATVEIDTSVSNNYVLDKTYSQPYNIEVNGIALPTFTVGENWHAYNGSTQHYYLSYRNEADKAEINITVPDEFKSLVNYDDGEVTVTRAGDYYLFLNLATDDGSTQWATGETTQQQLPFKVKQAPIEFDVTLDGSSDISVTDGDDVEVSVDGLDSVYSGDEISINVIATMKSASTVHKTIYSGLKIDEFTELPLKIELSTSSLSVDEWIISLELPEKVGNNSDYEIQLSNAPVTLTVEEKGGASNLRWSFSRDGISPVTQDMLTQQDIVSEVSVPYDGKEITVTARPSSGYAVDTSYTKDGFTAGYKNSKGKNVDTYTTYVAIKKGNEETKIYSITWTISKAQFDLSKVKWLGDGEVEYTGSDIEMVLENLPDGLEATYGGNTSGTSVGSKGEVIVTQFTLTGDAVGNYEVPDVNDWKTIWEIVPARIAVGNVSDWESKSYTNEDEGFSFDYYKLLGDKDNGIVKYKYYETDNTGKILEGAEAIESLDDIEYSATTKRFYKALPEITDTENYAFKDGVTDDNLYSPMFTVGGGASQVSVSIATDKIEYNGKPREVKLVINGSGATLNDFELTYYTGDVADDAHKLEGAPVDKGNYLVVISSNKKSVILNDADNEGKVSFTFEIISATISKNWNKTAKPYVLKLKYGQIDGVEYVIADEEGNKVAYSDLTAGNTYQIKAVIKEDMRNNYSFTDGTYETDWETFELRAEDIASMQDPNDPSNTHYPQGEDNDPSNPDDNNPSSGDVSGNDPSSGDEGGSGSLGDILEKLKEIPLWQLIASVISIILIIIFLSKTAGYESKRKKFNKKADKLETSVYAGVFLGLAFTAWTAIACVLMGLAVLSFVMMLIAKSRCNKAEENYEDCLEEYQRNKDDIADRKRENEYRRNREDEKENMRMMFMSMMGGNAGGMGQGMPQGGYMGGGYGIEDIRGIISETVTALLPGMQQLLPQQASYNDELMEQLIEKSEKNDEKIQTMIEKTDERFEQMMRTQEALIAKLLEREPVQQVAATQVVEKVVEVPVEKIVEKVVEVPVEVEKIVEKEVKVEVPVEVEKIVEKEVVKEVKVEVPVAVPTPSKPKKEVAPRLTLDEAYAILSKQQQKYFDGLRQYALSKPNSKEKKATYAITIGQSTVNPLLKLTIKKDMTVALFKMEDEYLKDIKRDATSDGTKVKVKETEVIISDAQACKVAKNMIDLREDQIERYQDLLKEQRAMKNKK